MRGCGPLAQDQQVGPRNPLVQYRANPAVVAFVGAADDEADVELHWSDVDRPHARRGRRSTERLPR